MASKTASAAPKQKAQPKENQTKCDLSKVKAGSMLSRHVFAVVTDVQYDKVGLRNDAGETWYLDKKLVETQCSFADQFEETKEFARREVIAELHKRPFTAITVNFHKKPKPEEVAAALKAGQGSMSDKDWKKHVETLMDGEESTKVGHHAGHLDEHGRLQFFSFDEGPRLVDPRTVNWFIADRVKYIVK